MNAHEGHSNHGSAHGDHERTDWRVSLVVWSVVSFFVLMFAAMLAMGWLFNTLGHAQGDVEPLSPLSEMRIEPPLPRLQVSPTDDLTQMQKDWQTELDSYGYVAFRLIMQCN